MTLKTKIKFRNCKSAAEHHSHSESEIHEDRNFFLLAGENKNLEFRIKKVLLKVSAAANSISKFF